MSELRPGPLGQPEIVDRVEVRVTGRPEPARDEHGQIVGEFPPYDFTFRTDSNHWKHCAEGRDRGDEVCRVPAWPRAERLAVLRDQESMAVDRLTNARRELAYAEGQLDRLRERIEEEARSE